MNDLKGIIEDCNKSDLVSYKLLPLVQGYLPKYRF